MTSYVENETGTSFPFDSKELLESIMEQVMEGNGCALFSQSFL